MANEQPTTPSNGAIPPEPASLRDYAEAAWDEVQDDAAASDDQPVDGGGQRRDAQGRFVAADQSTEPGVAEPPPDGSQPRPEDTAPGEAKPADPAQGSNQPPQHWPEKAREMFAKLPPEGQTFLLDRHTEMERDYQAKAQSAATAVQFTNALAPMFQHPAIAGSLQQSGLSPYDAIGQWASFHLRAVDPNPQVRMQLWQELGQRMGLDPAAAGQMSQPGTAKLSEDDLKDPAIRYFADTLGKTFSDVQALRGELDSIRQQEVEKANAAVLQVTRRSIDQFEHEKDAQGQPKHPHFEAVLGHMIELYRANPDRDLQEAYDMAIWAVPSIRASLLAAERNSVANRQGNERARQAVRSNVRGITSPVTKPAGDGKASGLRATLEAAAEEVGL